ncbi:MAG: hypothetical protein HY351_01855, partial [Candidatus Omnitrophica bacterium]|nr:hypothetical protein [Candidatus Omnitrophota bacterium]
MKTEKRFKFALSIFFVFLLIFNFSYPLTAQEPSTPSAAADQLYLEFKDAALVNVLRSLSDLTGMNFVAGKEVANRQVNMVLEGVTIDDALNALARGSNVVYDFIPGKNIYLFRAAADKEETPSLVTRVFKLYYIRASDLREIEAGEGGSSGGGTTSTATFSSLEEKAEAGSEGASSQILKIVKDILSERGRVNVDDRSNALVVTDTEDRVQMIEQAIVSLDRAVDQVLIRTILVETFEDLDRFLGIEWGGNTTSGQEGTLGLIQGGSTESRFPFNVNEYSVFTRLFGKSSLSKSSIVKDTDATTEGVKDFTDLDIRFRALQTAGKVKIVAKPKILVLDNHPALIKITTNEAIGSQTTTASADAISTSSTSVERAETGTSFRVTPLINTNNRITLTLEPRFVTATTAALNSTTRDPTIRTARTTLMVNDGQTIVLGGLLSSQQTNNVRKVPLLGDIPYLGEIFTRRSKTFDDRELVLFVSPKIIRNPAEVQPLFIPDDRERMEDVAAPFWKVKRKKWFRDLKAEAKKKASKAVISIEEMEIEQANIVARQRLMDEALAQAGKPSSVAQKT